METFRMISAMACFLGIVITVFSRLYPSEKFAKQMKTIFSLVFLISVATPLLNGKLNLPDISETIAASNSYYQEISSNADEYFIKSIENNISVRLEAVLNSKNIFPLEIQTNVNISEDDGIFINEITVLMLSVEYEKEIKDCIYENVSKDITVTVKTKEGQYEYQYQ